MHSISFDSLNCLLNSINFVSSATYWIRSVDMTRQIYLSPSFESVYGQKCQKLYDDPFVWSSLIDTSDRKHAEQQFYQRLQQQVENLEVFTPIFYRIRHASEEVKFIKNLAFPLRDAKGDVFAIMGVSETVQEREWSQGKARSLRPQIGMTQHQSDIQASSCMRIDIQSILIKELQHQRIGMIDMQARQMPALTNREKETLAHLLQGGTAKQIAKNLGISPRTVEIYTESLKQKFGCQTKLALLNKLHEIL